MTASEREAEARQLLGAEDPAPEAVSADIVSRDKLADKGRVRRIKVKVYRVLELPKIMQEKLLGDAWKDRFDEVRTN